MPITNSDTANQTTSANQDRQQVRTTSLASWDRAANTTAYADGDAIGDGTGATLEFPNVALRPGGSVELRRVSVAMEGSPTVVGLELLLFDAAPTDQTDNSAVALVEADMAKLVARIPIASGDGRDVGGLVEWNAEPAAGVPIVCEASSVALYGILIARGALTPVSSGKVLVRLTAVADA